MKNITILDIIKVAKWKDVERSIKFHYLEDKNEYSPIFKRIQKFPKEVQMLKTERIVITCNDCMSDDEPLSERIGEQFYRMCTNKYSLCLRPWKEVANILISEDTLKHYKFNDILAHFIWEITYYGDEKSFLKEIEESKKEMKEILKTNKIKCNNSNVTTAEK